MGHRIPSTVRATFKDTTAQGLPGHAWSLVTRDNHFLAEGFSLGKKSAARKDAWNALEQLGLVIDE